MKGKAKRILVAPLLKKIAVSKLILLATMVFAILNATLRLTESGMTSIYRLVSPFLFLVVFLFYWKWLKREIVVIITGIIYGLSVSVLFYGHISFDMWVFLAYLCMLYVFVRVLFYTSSNFTAEFFCFLNIVTIITLVLCWIQYFVRVPYPFLNLAHDPGVNVFMSNENELASPLSCMLIIYLYKICFEKKWKYIPIAVNILYFVYINDAKLSLIGIAMAIAVFCIFGLFFLLSKKYNITAKKFIGVSSISVVIVLVLIILINPEITFRDYNVSVRELIFDAIADIIMLKPTLGSGGSLVDRTNAIIFGLIELKNTAFFGIGWGNSIMMLDKPEYILMTAKSMHNIVFQFLVEFGFFAVLCYVAIIAWMIKCIKYSRKRRWNVLKVAFSVGFVFISSQSSVGILSNYYAWLVVFFVAFSGKKPTAQKSTQKADTIMDTAKSMLAEMKNFIKKCITWCCTTVCLLNVKKRGKNITVNYPCKFTSNTEVGNHCHFNGIEITGSGRCVIGDNFHSGKRVRVLTSYHNYEGGNALPYDDTYIHKDVIIGENVWIGQDVTILAGVTIGEGAVIQAGSVVCKDVPPLAVAGGHPAKAFKYRNEAHYYALKEKQ